MIDMTNEQNREMYGRYRENANVCPECENLCSPQAQRCMRCRVLRRFVEEGKKTIFITNDADFRLRAKKRIKELALEQGWSLKHAGLE